jgi:hypothetical protein
MHEGSLVELKLVNETNVLVRVHDTTDQFYIGVNEATAALMQSYLG